MSQLLQGEVAGAALTEPPPRQDDWLLDDWMVGAASQIITGTPVREAYFRQRTTGGGSLFIHPAASAPGSLSVLMVGLFGTNPVVTGVTDNRGNVYTLVNSLASGTGFLGMYYLVNGPGYLATDTITAATTGAITNQRITWLEFGSVPLDVALDTAGTASGTGTAVSVSAISPVARTNEISLTGVMSDSTTTTLTASGQTAGSNLIDASLVSAPAFTDYQHAKLVAGSTATQGFTWSASTPWLAVTAVFRWAGTIYPPPIYAPLMAGQTLGGPIMAATPEPSLYLNGMTDDWVEESASQLLVILEPDASLDTTPPTVGFFMDGL